MARACLCATLAGLVAGRARAADSLSVHVEAGVGTDVTNEQFYEDVYQDTTFLGRRLQGTPEARTAAEFLGEVMSRSDGGRREMRLTQDLELGDKLMRAAESGYFALRPGAAWRLSLEPQLEASRDLSFGLDRHEARAAVTARARRLLANDVDAIEFLGNGDFLRTAGSSDAYVLPHDNGRFGIAWDHTPWFGWEWRIDAETNARAFPDSTQRDHFEHRGGLSLRRDLAGGHSLALAVDGGWRETMTPQVSSRDRYRTAEGSLEGTARFSATWSLRGTLEGELLRYDAPDSTIDFDYQVSRARLMLRREWAGAWTLALGPRAEQLAAAWDPAERYREVAGQLELERLDAGRWWSIEPEAGWRGYELSSTNVSLSSVALHSSFAFYGLVLFLDQGIGAGLRVRASGDGRIERHQDPSQDSRSLYFSLDVRRLF